MITAPRYNLWDAITKSDTVDFFRGICDAVYVGGAGVVVAIQEDGTAVSFTAVAGQVIPIAAKRINSTNTTATLMIALYQK